MIVIFPVDEDREACIAWGKVRLPRGFQQNSPVTVQEYANGALKYSFNMNVTAKRIGTGKKAEMYFEDANVAVWSHEENPMERKLSDCVKLLRPSDPVLVIGKHESRTWYDPRGVEHSGHNIYADAVIPVAWLYDVMLALFAQIVAKAEPPATKKIKDRPAPKKKTDQPTVAHVNVMDDEEWRRFE